MATNGQTGSDYTVPLLIDGKEITTSSTFDVISPSTGEKLWQSSAVSHDDALAAISAAEKALPAWAKTKPAERRDILLKAADCLEKRRNESFKYVNDETGTQESFFSFTFGNAVEILRDVAGRISLALQGEAPVCGKEGTSALFLREPYGVVYSIAPWLVLPFLEKKKKRERERKPQNDVDVDAGTHHLCLEFDQSRTLSLLATRSYSRARSCHHVRSGSSERH